MTHRRALFALSLMVVLAGGCAPGATGGTTRDRDVIAREEFQDMEASTTYEVVRRFRPQWLRARAGGGISGPGEVSVYLDDVRFGVAESLQSVPAGSVERVEWVDAVTATQRWGTGNASGAIAVYTVGGG